MTQKNARHIDLRFLELYYLNEWTLQKIGDKYGVSRQRALQRIQRAQDWVKSFPGAGA